VGQKFGLKPKMKYKLLIKIKFKSMIHILFKHNRQDLFSTGKSYQGDVCLAFAKWQMEFPDATFIGLYPHKVN